MNKLLSDMYLYSENCCWISYNNDMLAFVPTAVDCFLFKRKDFVFFSYAVSIPTIEPSLFGTKTIIQINIDKTSNIQSILNTANDDVFIIVVSESSIKPAIFPFKIDVNAMLEHIANKNNITFDKELIQILIEKNHNNASQLHQEYIKLIEICNSKNENFIGIDYEKYITENQEFTVYELSNSYLSGNIELSKKIFRNISEREDEIPLILWIIHNDLNKLINIKGLLQNNHTFNTAVKQLKIHYNSVNSYQLAEKRINYQQLLKYYDKVSIIDKSYKGLIDNDYIFMLEVLIINISRGV